MFGMYKIWDVRKFEMYLGCMKFWDVLGGVLNFEKYLGCMKFQYVFNLRSIKGSTRKVKMGVKENKWEV